jgi:transcriptional regulator with XRE-family HTH domain
MDLSMTAISKIEHGDRKLTLEEAVLCASILQVSLYTLAGLRQPIADTAAATLARCKQHCQEGATLFQTIDHELESIRV